MFIHEQITILFYGVKTMFLCYNNSAIDMKQAKDCSKDLMLLNN